MNWLQLLKNSYKKPWFKVVLILVFLAIFWLFKFSPQDKGGPILSYLPADTNFFYEWTDAQSKNSDYLSGFEVFSSQMPDAKKQDLKKVCGQDCPDISELIWFKVNGMAEDHYLIKVSDWPKKSFKVASSSNPDFIFKQLSPHVYLITSSNSLAESINGPFDNNFDIVEDVRGVNIYWSVSQAPEFLSDISKLISPALTQDNIFMNVLVKDSKFIFKFFQATGKSQVDNTNSLAEISLPNDLSLAIGFSAKSSQSFSQNLMVQLVEPIFQTLPQQNFQKDELSTYLAGNNMLIQQGEDWLLVGFNDWRPIVGKFLSNIQAKEVKKKLPDGTIYTELQVADDQVVADHEFAGQKYWQIGDLFGFQLADTYYLTGRQYLLEQLINKPITLANHWPCGQIDGHVSDVLMLSVPVLPEGAIRTYLQNKNIKSLNILSFSNNSTKGWQLCVY